MQMAAILLSIQNFGWWITLFSYINIANYSFCVIFVLFLNKGITPSQLSAYRMFYMFAVPFYLYR
mgnify:CR=1 FL=1